MTKFIVLLVGVWVWVGDKGHILYHNSLGIIYLMIGPSNPLSQTRQAGRNGLQVRRRCRRESQKQNGSNFEISEITKRKFPGNVKLHNIGYHRATHTCFHVNRRHAMSESIIENEFPGWICTRLWAFSISENQCIFAFTHSWMNFFHNLIRHGLIFWLVGAIFRTSFSIRNWSRVVKTVSMCRVSIRHTYSLNWTLQKSGHADVTTSVSYGVGVSIPSFQQNLWRIEALHGDRVFTISYSSLVNYSYQWKSAAPKIWKRSDRGLNQQK